MKKIPTPINTGVAKVPLRLKAKASESGAACLTMILSYYRSYLSLGSLKKDCGISEEGTTPENILTAAQKHQLTAEKKFLPLEELKKKGSFPCILFLDTKKFVVLCGYQGNHFIINDPEKGSMKVSSEALTSCFSGVVLFFSPFPDFKPKGDAPTLTNFVKNRLKGNGLIFLLASIATFIVIFITLFNPAFSQIFLDRILGDPYADWLYPFVFILLGLNFLQISVGYLRDFYFLKIKGKFEISANSHFMWHVLRLPVEYFTKHSVGQILSWGKANEEISNQIITTLAPAFLNIFTLVLYLVVVLRLSVSLTLIGIAALVLNLLINQYISMKRRDITGTAREVSGKLTGITMSGLEMIETIKSSGAENGFFQNWAGHQAKMNNAYVKRTNISEVLEGFPSFIKQLSNISILVLGGYLIILGEWSLGTLLAFQGYLKGFMSPVDKLIKTRGTLLGLQALVPVVEDVLKYEPDVFFKDNVLDDSVDYQKLSGLIEIKNLSFGYSQGAPPIIENFNLTIEPGEKIALVGSSGCGKSTLGRLISGLYEPWEGEILFDGKNHQDIPREIFTSSLAAVDQDIILFDDTIAENIRMWDASIENFAVICAARDVNIHETIMQRKDGYQHRLLKGGGDFSGGQRQLLEIARVLAQDPTLVILDEATSALDAKSEYDVVKAIEDRGITSIIIAHRLSTIRNADKILVLDHGKIIESGTHEELAALGGFYSALIANT